QHVFSVHRYLPMSCAVRCCACQNDSVMPARTTRWFQVQPALQRSSRHGRDGPTTCCSLAPMSPEANPRHVTKCCPIRWPIAQGQTRITVWLPVRVLPGPPRSPTLTEISRGLTNTRGYAGRRAGLQSLQGRRTASEAVRGLLSLAIQKPFPGAWEGAVRDSVRMRQRPVCGQDPSRRFVARDERASKLRVACGTASHRSCNRL